MSCFNVGSCHVNRTMLVRRKTSRVPCQHKCHISCHTSISLMLMGFQHHANPRASIRRSHMLTCANILNHSMTMITPEPFEGKRAPKLHLSQLLAKFSTQCYHLPTHVFQQLVLVLPQTIRNHAGICISRFQIDHVIHS